MRDGGRADESTKWVVYRFNIIEPRTEPWGTPHARKDEGESCDEMETTDVRDDKYEVNH